MSDYDMFNSLLGLSLGLILFVSIIALAIIVLYVICNRNLETIQKSW